MNNLTKNILDKISAGEVAMKPRWHFVLQTLLIIVGVVFFALLVMYVLSFVGFMIRMSGAAFVPTLGTGGVLALLFALPWLLVLVALVFLVVLEILVQRFAFTRQMPLVYSIFGVILLTFLGSYVMLKTSVHPIVQNLHEKGRAPLVGSLYEKYGDTLPAQVTVGVVTDVANASFVMLDRDQMIWQVQVTEDTRGASRVELSVGTALVVLGKRGDGVIMARGIREVPDDIRPPQRGRSDAGDPVWESR